MCKSMLVGVAVVVLWAGAELCAQQAGQAADTPASARSGAPADFTGTWVSVITEDWRWRMVTPGPGDYASIPITEEARLVADGWNPQRDEALGQACRSHGAAGLMRLPGRIRITWQDENTLRVEADAGTQTRLLHFDAEARGLGPGEPSWQGHSVAEWETDDGQPGSDPTGSLTVVTTNMLPGYLRKNGVPYSGDAVLTEYWDINTAPGGDPWIVITTVVDDPTYLQKPYVTSPNFRKEADDSRWNPTPCSATW